MKELSIEQKAKAYDKVIEKAKIYNSDNTQQVVKNLVTYLFPELKESEDERIRKGLIENFKWFCGDFPETTKWGKDDDLLVKDIIDWLEKQGELDDNIITNDDEILQAISVGLTDVVEDAGWSDFGGIPIKEIQDWLKKKSQTFTKKDIDDAYLKGVCDAKQELEKQGKVPVTVNIEKMVRDYANNKERGNEEFGKPVNCMIRAYRQGLNDAISTLVLNKQGEQKPVDKVEPKFHEGDWVIINGLVLKILKIQGDLCEILFQQDELRVYKTSIIDNEARLWTIEDAKDGDVLISHYNDPFIYKGLCDNLIDSYCGILKGNKFHVADKRCSWTVNSDIRPATKEQRDLLFQKMKEAGYEFDFEKKELKMLK